MVSSTDSEPRDAAELGPEVAATAWAEAARELLIDTARSYRSVVAARVLAEGVQQRTGIRTTRLAHYWTGDVLRRVAEECAARGEPNLASLCVNTAGSVGDGYAAVVGKVTGEVPRDGDDHAARARLECYRHFGATDLPADGGSAALTEKLSAARTRSRKVAQESRPVTTCPTCFVAVPASGVCDTCD